MKALITGASCGIGEAFAEKFAQMGYDLIITGRKKDMLQSISRRIQERYNVSVETIIIELSIDEEVNDLTARIRTENLDILVNNAGFGSRSSFLEEDYLNQELMIKVHVLVPMKLIHAVLPGMIRRNTGIVINVSSLAGNIPLPTGSVYSASKSFLRILSESLYLENMHSNIIFQALCPGFTRTGFHERIGYHDAALRNKGIIRWMRPEKVVEISLKNLRKGKVLCIPGFWNKVLWWLADFIPRKLYYRMVSSAIDRSKFYGMEEVLKAVRTN